MLRPICLVVIHLRGALLGNKLFICVCCSEKPCVSFFCVKHDLAKSVAQFERIDVCISIEKKIVKIHHKRWTASLIT